MRVAACTAYQQRAASLDVVSGSEELAAREAPNRQAEMVSQNLTEEREEHVLSITISPLTRRYSLDSGGGTP